MTIFKPMVVPLAPKSGEICTGQIILQPISLKSDRLLGIAYGGFSYTKDTTAVKLGPIELTVKERETVNVPLWAGIGAIALGAALFVMGGKKP